MAEHVRKRLVDVLEEPAELGLNGVGIFELERPENTVASDTGHSRTVAERELIATGSSANPTAQANLLLQARTPRAWE